MERSHDLRALIKEENLIHCDITSSLFSRPVNKKFPLTYRSIREIWRPRASLFSQHKLSELYYFLLIISRSWEPGEIDQRGRHEKFFPFSELDNWISIHLRIHRGPSNQSHSDILLRHVDNFITCSVPPINNDGWLDPADAHATKVVARSSTHFE